MELESGQWGGGNEPRSGVRILVGCIGCVSDEHRPAIRNVVRGVVWVSITRRVRSVVSERRPGIQSVVSGAVGRKDRWRGWGSVSPDRAALAALTPVLSSRRIFPVLTRRHTLGPVPSHCASATRKRRGREAPAWNAGNGSSRSSQSVYEEILGRSRNR